MIIRLRLDVGAIGRGLAVMAMLRVMDCIYKKSSQNEQDVCAFTDDGCEELWSRAAGCHEGGSCNVLAQIQFLHR